MNPRQVNQLPSELLRRRLLDRFAGFLIRGIPAAEIVEVKEIHRAHLLGGGGAANADDPVPR